MSYKATVIEVFLSSPSDVSLERDIVIQTSLEWNRLRSRDMGCFISILTWEDAVSPALLERSQEVINYQIGDVYDVYLGLMWTKFGTPTGEAQSGTEEEFLRAFNQAQAGRNVRIAMMFKTGDINPAKIDPHQLVRVHNFKEFISRNGAFYREFGNNETLRSALNLLFEQIAKSKDEYVTSKHEHLVSPNMPMNIDVSSSEPADDGLIEIGDRFDETVSRFTENLQVILEAENSNTAQIKAASNELSDVSAFGSGDRVRIREIMKKVALSMETLSEKYELVFSKIEDDAASMSQLMEADLKIRFEVDDWHSSASDNLEAARSFIVVLDAAIVELETLTLTTESLPRLSGVVNKAKSGLSKERRKVIDSFKILRQSIFNLVIFFDPKESN